MKNISIWPREHYTRKKTVLNYLKNIKESNLIDYFYHTLISTEHYLPSFDKKASKFNISPIFDAFLLFKWYSSSFQR